MNSLVAVLLSWIHITVGYPVPSTLPTVEFVPHKMIVDTMCDGHECPVLGMYLHGDTIYLDNRLDVQLNDYHTSILLHELVHYAQDRSGQFPNRDCSTWLDEEREAFAIQTAWLRERSVSFPQRHQIPRRDFCGRVAPSDAR
jgi:hypothetical protein